MEQRMEEPYTEEVATHGGPESCVDVREGIGEALTGARVGEASSREIIPPGRRRGNGLGRQYGWYANRPRGIRRQAAAAADGASAPIAIAEREALPLRVARRRWAELLRRLYEVDPLACPACGGAMRILAFITEGAVINRILTHLRRARSDARGPPAPRVSS
jgi:hypothetical protein